MIFHLINRALEFRHMEQRGAIRVPYEKWPVRRTPKIHVFFLILLILFQLLSITPAEGIGNHNIHVLAKLVEDSRMEHEKEPLYLC